MAPDGRRCADVQLLRESSFSFLSRQEGFNSFSSHLKSYYMIFNNNCDKAYLFVLHNRFFFLMLSAVEHCFLVVVNSEYWTAGSVSLINPQLVTADFFLIIRSGLLIFMLSCDFYCSDNCWCYFGKEKSTISSSVIGFAAAYLSIAAVLSVGIRPLVNKVGHFSCNG